jgi:hypothetical protein
MSDAEDRLISLSLVLGFFGSWAIFAWGLGWHWWWALPAAVPTAVVVGGVVFGVLMLVFDREFLHALHDEDAAEAEPEDVEQPDSTSAENTGQATNADYQRLKRAMAKRLHPDLQPAASRGERRVREAVFKEFWAEVEKIEGRG